MDESPGKLIPDDFGACSFQILRSFSAIMRHFLNMVVHTGKKGKNADFDSVLSISH